MIGPAVINLAFDPVIRLGGLEVLAQTVLLALVLLAGLLLAARIGHLTPQPGPYVPPPPLRPDDIPFLVLGIVPGAVIGGRLEYVLVHLDYYLATPAAIANPGQGGLGLALAVAGGVIGGVVIARLVGAPAGRWLHAGVLPLLFVLAGGKLASLLAGEGQGLPADLAWATTYAGPGPWASLAPEVASHPSQAYEAIATTLVIVLIGLGLRLGAFGRRDGAALLTGVALWGIARGVVAFTWRDAAVAGPFRAEHLILAVVVVGCVAGLIPLRRAAGGAQNAA
ncbi:MAG: prolipoprotein diacylglyceryl transferase [Chloroflexi bacterium]|nr:prolipoprotein diacylglyceryl transferase [Chloroflexota bacterium]